MHMEGAGKRLTIYCSEYDRYHHSSLGGAILERAREEGLAGATLSSGIEGFGSARHLHTSRFLSLYDNMPVVVQIVDDARRIEGFLPLLDDMIQDGLVTIEDLDILTYQTRRPHPLDDDEQRSG